MASVPGRLQAGDWIKVTVYGEPSLSGDFQIDPTGSVLLPLAGPTKAAGVTPAELADALTKINQPLVPQFLMSGVQGQDGANSGGGLIPTALLSSLFGRMMPDALEKLKEEAPRPPAR